LGFGCSIVKPGFSCNVSFTPNVRRWAGESLVLVAVLVGATLGGIGASSLIYGQSWRPVVPLERRSIIFALLRFFYPKDKLNWRKRLVGDSWPSAAGFFSTLVLRLAPTKVNGLRFTG